MPGARSLSQSIPGAGLETRHPDRDNKGWTGLDSNSDFRLCLQNPPNQLTSSRQMCVLRCCRPSLCELRVWDPDPWEAHRTTLPRMLRAFECGCPSPRPWSYLPARPRGLALALGFSLSTGLWIPQCPGQRGMMCSMEGKARPGK